MELVVASSIYAEGDMLITNISNVMAKNGLILERMGTKYIQKGVAPFHLLHEHNYRLIVNIKLTNLEGRTMSYFVAWDGKVIYDQLFTSKVDKSHDRTNLDMSNTAFGKLYPKSKFVS